MTDTNVTLDPSVLPYLRQADNAFRSGFQDDAMRSIFFERVFEEIKGYESKLSLMKSSCFIMEQFIAEANAQQILQVLKAFKGNFEELSHSSQGCHVLQKTFETFLHLLNCKEPNEDFTEHFDTIVNVAKATKTDEVLVSWMCDRYATHVMRSVFETLGGVKFAEQRGSSNEPKKTYNREKQQDVVLPKDKIPKSFLLRLKKLTAHLCKLNKKKMAETLTSISGCPCACLLLRVLSLRLPKTLKRTCGKIIEILGGPADSTLLLLAKDKTGSRFLEALFEFGDSATCKAIYSAFASEASQLIELSCHPVANFVIQKLISSPRLQDKFSEIVQSLLPGVEDIFVDGRFGVIQKLAEQCLQTGTCQNELLNCLLKAFHCQEADKHVFIVPLIASFTTYDKLVMTEADQEQPPDLQEVTYHGSLLLQALFKFENSASLSKSITSMPCQHSLALSNEISGSHVIDAFLNSGTVKNKWKKTWFDKMKDHFSVMACSKYGSRVIDNIWKSANIQVKTMLAENLVKHSKTLLADQYGKHVHRNLGLKQFSERRSDWVDFQERILKKRKMFQDLIQTDGSGAGKRTKL